MISVLVPAGSLAAGGVLDLEPGEAQHLRVRRAGTGDRIRVLDGAGVVGEGVLEMGKGTARVEIASLATVPQPPALILAVAAGDRERFGWMVEKSAELGVTRIIPLETQRSVNVAGRIRASHVERLAIRAREAIKQSGAPWAPLVDQPVPLDEFVAGLSEGDRWLADPAGGGWRMSGPAVPLTIAVGPEGGFTDGERERLTGSGFLPVSLSPYVLRFETAAFAAAVLAAQGRKEQPG
ncbi:MAG: RsmE family RNA methyltransferase [Gemmatimonadales bacterium]